MISSNIDASKIRFGGQERYVKYIELSIQLVLIIVPEMNERYCRPQCNLNSERKNG